MFRSVSAAATLAVALGGIALAQSPVGPTLATAVETVLARPYLPPGTVSVTVEGRHVTLRGRVPESLVRALAVRLAANVPGVRTVEDALVVDETVPRWRPTANERRQDVVANVRATLRTDPELRDYTTLRASLERGTVIVRGQVARFEHRVAVDARVLASPGVRLLDNRVAVEADAPRRSPPAPPREDEAALERELATSLGEDPLLAARARIEPRVGGGRIILAGTASDRVARDYALAVATRLARAYEAARERRPGPFERLLESGRLAPEAELDRPPSLGEVIANVQLAVSEEAR